MKSAYVLKEPAGIKAGVKKSKVTVSFKKEKQASGYEIFRAAKKNGKYKKAASLKSVKKVFTQKKGTYYYKVRAYKQAGKKKPILGIAKS